MVAAGETCCSETNKSKTVVCGTLGKILYATINPSKCSWDDMMMPLVLVVVENNKGNQSAAAKNMISTTRASRMNTGGSGSKMIAQQITEGMQSKQTGSSQIGRWNKQQSNNGVRQWLPKKGIEKEDVAAFL